MRCKATQDEVSIKLEVAKINFQKFDDPITPWQHRCMGRDIVILRGLIDALDQEMVALLAKRQRIVEEVIIYKKAHNIPAVIPERIQAVLNHVGKLAKTQQADVALVQGIYKFMIDYFCQFEDQHLQQN